VIQTIDAATRAVRKPDLGILYLPIPCLTAQLPYNFRRLGEAGCTDGMPFRQEPAARVYRNAAVDSSGALSEQLNCVTMLAESQGFVIKQLGNGECIVGFGNVNVLRAIRPPIS